MISDRFEDFSQSLRVFIEQKLRFSHLSPIDAAEAIGNVEHAMKGKLDAFHSLYDAARAHPEVSFDFYANPLCCFVLHYLRWSRLVRQFGGLAKVDRVGFYAANCSVISAVA